MQPPSLHLENVHVLLGPGRAMTVSRFHAEGGSKTLVHGPSGGGKTTLLHLVAGLLVPNEGKVEVGGIDYAKLSEGERSRLRRKEFGVVFQTLNLLDHLTTLENVLLALPGDHQKEQRLKAMDALAMLHMEHAASAKTRTLSLGERQRVAVARVLAARPRIIIADEPTSSLDDANAAIVMNALMVAAAEATLLVASHDARVHERFDDRVATGEVIK